MMHYYTRQDMNHYNPNQNQNETNYEMNSGYTESIYSNETPVDDKADDNGEAAKRTRRLIRNREAARRNRLKKKEWIDGLQNANRIVKSQNALLKSKMLGLQNEMMMIQNRINELGFPPFNPTGRGIYQKID
ncbi:hypothetical protein BC833DRAFT_652544 [Globomyces pollinis-pini]|nr:hypothetical protein BC833DRAFT_652544 [Globomyces pollinis-pini]KAJ2992145.1 hypothetical protein HDV02_003261 [Globomyces sp. JEL0801]